jgi:hypothetical protein
MRRSALRAFLSAVVEPVAADVGRAREHLVDTAKAPAAAIAGPDAGRVEVLGDRLDAHRSRRAVALTREAEDQPHRLGLDRIDLKGLLGAMAVLLGSFHNPVADGRQRAVPKALAGILLHGPQGVWRSPWTGTRRTGP